MENTTSNNQRNKIGTIGFIISLITLVLFGTSLVFFLSSVPWVGLLFLVVLLFWLLGFILSAIGLGKKPIGLAIAGVAISLLVIFIAFNQDVYNAIYQVNKAIDFETAKKQRYTEVIKKLKDIRAAQDAYLRINGKYADNFDQLTNFIENAQFTITSQRDTSWTEFDKTFNIDVMRQGVRIDTLGYVKVKDSLFKDSDRYKTLRYVPKFIKDEDPLLFTMKTGEIKDKNNVVSFVFEAYVLKKDVLKGLSPSRIEKELHKNSFDDVRGDKIKVGSLEELTINGNWPTSYDAKIAKENK